MRLPGVGRRAAERFAYSLLQSEANNSTELAEAIVDLRRRLSACQQCGQFSELKLCAICADASRLKNELCVVAEGRDIMAIEQTKHFHGIYLVLGGLIDPIGNIHPENLRLQALRDIIKSNGVAEVVLALNADIRGDATVLYLARLLKPLGVKVTRLARGLPIGSRLEYADEATLDSALLNRKEI